MCRWHCGSYKGKEIDYVYGNDDECRRGGTPRFETETANVNVPVSKVIKNGYYVNKENKNSQTLMGCGHIIDGVFTSDYLSSWGTATYDSATNTLIVTNKYTTGTFYFYIID